MKNWSTMNREGTTLGALLGLLLACLLVLAPMLPAQAAETFRHDVKVLEGGRIEISLASGPGRAGDEASVTVLDIAADPSIPRFEQVAYVNQVTLDGQGGATVVVELPSSDLSQFQLAVNSTAGGERYVAPLVPRATPTPIPTPTPEPTPEPTPIAPAGALKVTATVLDASRNGVGELGESLTYAFRVANTGGSPVTGLSVTSTRGAVSCPATVLDAGAALTCTLEHVVTPADVAAGAVTGAATAAGTSNGVPVTSKSSATTLRTAAPTPAPTATPTPTAPPGALKVTATVIDASRNGVGQLGETLRYSFKVTNSGGTPVTGLGVVSTKGAVACPSTTLDVGASLTCTGEYVVTAADVAAGAVTASATAKGLSNGVEVVSKASGATLRAA